jgi:hypothetical protein
LEGGVEGPQGPQGPQGEQGPAGPQGLAGTNGINGVNGADGATGPAGPTGSQGLAGTNGIDGVNGADGAAGPAGPTGSQGLAGTNGIDGVNGADGATGPAGPTGPQGLAGTNGIDGVNGATGAEGPQGPSGAEISGQLDACTPTGGLGIMAHIPGKSFSVRLPFDGSFVFSHVPAGTHSIIFELNENVIGTLAGVMTNEGQTTDVGTFVTPFCQGDSDGDGITGAAGDCDNTNASIFPGNAEVCDSIDNNCDGQVDEDGACQLCPSGQNTCDGICVDLNFDRNNCGQCGNRCDPDSSLTDCVVGICSDGS